MLRSSKSHHTGCSRCGAGDCSARDGREGPARHGRTAAPVDLSGLWAFTHFNERFQGTIQLRPYGSDFAGVWHTAKGQEGAG